LTTLYATRTGTLKTHAAAALAALLLLAPPPIQAQPAAGYSPKGEEVAAAGDRVVEWREGSTRFLLLEGDAIVQQSLDRIRADSILLWIDGDQSPGQTTVHVLANGQVRVEGAGRDVQRLSRHRHTLQTDKGLRIASSTVASAPPPCGRPLLDWANQIRASQRELAAIASLPRSPADEGVLQAEWTAASGAEAGAIVQLQGIEPPSFPSPAAPSVVAAPGEPPSPAGSAASTPSPMLAGPFFQPNAAGVRRIRWFPRTSQPFNVSSSMTPEGERRTVFTGGINIIVEDLATANTVDIVADRAVLWITGNVAADPTGGLVASPDQRTDVYLEGNVYIRQGNPSRVEDSMSAVLFGKQVYFNVNTNQALVLDGDVETFEPKSQTPLFMTAQEIRQLSPGVFYGKQAAFTTSVHRGTPGYAFTGREVYFDEVRRRIRNPFTGQDAVDAATGEPLETSLHYVTSYSNVLRINNVPVFYWPYLRANAEDPLGPIEDVRVGQTQNLGAIGSLTLDLWQLTGLDYLPAAENSNWLWDVGYFSRRGFSTGSRFNYFGDGLFAQDDVYWGDAQTWYIHDDGRDYLGQGRNGIVPSMKNRGRARYQHRHDLWGDTTFIGEVSYLSDSNVLESFFEVEYDTGKDQDTLLYAKKSREDWAITGLVQPRLRDFLPQNDWLPRADFLLIGRPLFGDRVTYITRSSIGYGGLNPPSNYTLPTDVQIDLGRLDTRHEFDLPLSLGPWEVTPFVVGQFSGYTDAPVGEAVGRLYGAAGVRTSLPFFRVYPGVQSSLFYLNGLAHKVAINADYLFARSSEPFQNLPLMDQLDDDASELVRRQNLIREFGGVTPLRYDPRFIANRMGLTFYPEAIDDMDQFRLSVTNRLQTKRGPQGKQRILDWMVLDVGASAFPNADRDNLGSTFGLIDYNYRWNVGDRTSLQSNMLFEPFDDTLQLAGAVTLQRPPRGTVSMFVSYFDSGPFTSNYVGASTAYRFSKRYAGAIDVGRDLNAATSTNVRASFSRIGLDFVTTLGVVWNAGRDDFGVDFSILPRVAARNTFGRGALRTLPYGVEPAADLVPSSLDRIAIVNAASAN
jgi:hypothetical protein